MGSLCARTILIVAQIWVLLLAQFELTFAQQHTQYIRMAHDEKGEVQSLDIAITRFEKFLKVGGKFRRRIVVDLIGALHIADESYYENLNRLFDRYHLLLYELIAPRAKNIPDRISHAKCESDSSPLSIFQSGFGSMLGLDFQLELVDYTKKNFVHADLSSVAFANALKNNAESFTQVFFSLLRQSYVKQFEDFEKSQVLGLKMILSLLSPNRGLILKKVMAEQLIDLDEEISSLMGPFGTAIIDDRNKKALAVLRKLMKTTRFRRYGIFYGAGHMPDMAQRLEHEFGMQRVGQRWLTAWQLKTSVKKVE